MLEAENNLSIPNLETKRDEYDSYQCTLSAKFKDIAKEELREDESVRSQSLSQFREWIAKHPHIKKCRTGKQENTSQENYHQLKQISSRRAVSSSIPTN